MRKPISYPILFALAAIACICLAALSLFLAHIFPDQDGQTAAAWFQAVGSVAAIFFAIVLAKYQIESSRSETERAQRLAETGRRKGILAVAAAANHRAELIGESLSSGSPRIALYSTYDRSIIDGMVAALSAAPVYEMGSPEAVVAVIKMRDQFVFLGGAVDIYIAGPWKHPEIGPELTKGFSYSDPTFRKSYEGLAESSEKQLAKNALERSQSIQAAFKDLSAALRPYPIQ